MININKIFNPCFFIFLMIFMWTNGFMLKAFSLDEKYHVLKIITEFSILLISIIFLIKEDNIKLFKNVYFKSILAILIFASLPTFINGTLFSGNDIIEIFRLTQFYYSYLIFIILFLWVGSNNLYLKKINTTIIYTSAFFCLLLVFCAIFPNIGKEILVDAAYLPSRYGNIRITPLSSAMPFITYTLIYLFLTLNQKNIKKSLLHIVMFAIVTYYYFFVFMSTSANIGICFLLIIYILNTLKIGLKKIFQFFIGISMILFMVYFIFSNNDTTDIIFKILHSSNIEFFENLRVRTDGISYLYNEFASTWGLGFGLISNERAQGNVLTEGFSRGYNPADMGIFGVFLIYGFPAIIATFIICNNFFANIRTTLNHIYDNQIIIIQKSLAGYLIYSALTFSQFFFWDQFSLSWGIFFYMGWSGYELSKISQINNNNISNRKLI